MNEEQSSYKVTDRRLFNPDGTPREVPPEEQPAPEPAARVSATPDVPISQPQSEEESVPLVEELRSTTPSSANSPEPSAEAETELPGAEDPASFASFMMSIASNAASSLGMMEHPVTGKREVDLELGKHWIDILGMLEKKTAGNLLPQEKQILEGLLADLRMQYVSLTNATPPKTRAFSGRDITGG
ncbi:MAG TPA: DUF1844 domain-containing protein [Pyrinomonadaceae bacterium]|nr:DUF1844 domain-containing protein [Pyrinomonadaceae bacterium]